MITIMFFVAAMGNWHHFLYLLGMITTTVVIYCVEDRESKGDVLFDGNYKVIWGKNHSWVLKQGREVGLTMDKITGSGFQSKSAYGSGFFHLKIKLTKKDSAGVITAFYLSSKGKYHDEVDIEFLGNKPGKPILLQTNVFVHGNGEREQRTRLWFDPTAHFHSYKILWNHKLVVFYVDNTPIRVFKNKARKSYGVKYITQAMRIEASIWDGDRWATDGGRTKTNWSNAPFVSNFQHFTIDGCPITKKSQSPIKTCSFSYSKYWWNQKHYWTLGAQKLRELKHVRDKYMAYDYCDDHIRFPTRPLECAYNT